MTDVLTAPLLTFRLPDAGEGLTEAEIVRWLVAPGDPVAVNQPVLEIETAKSVVELPSPFAGQVVSLAAAEGAVVPVGDPILLVRPSVPAAGGPPADAVSPPADAVSPPADAASPADGADGAVSAVLVGYGPGGPRGAGAMGGTAPGLAAAAAAGSWAAAAPTGARHRDGGPHTAAAPTDSAGVAARPKAKPPVRALARQRGIGLEAVTPSGPGGTITRADVERAAGGRAADGEPDVTRRPIRSVRRATAAAMVESAFSAPHASLFIEVDATAGLKFARRGGLGFLSLAAFALVRAAVRHPVINARWDQAAGEIVYHHHVGLGLAVDSPRGLLVPCLRRADRLSLPELAQGIRPLIETARSGAATPDELRGGTITLTNVGTLGVDGGSPILVPGQVAILALGAIRPRPWARKGKVRVRSVGRLTLTFDHRLVDGADAAAAIKDIAAVLERPENALL
ncbi:MAG: 2-oxo acid dehydrogenase subunit E2 [Bifidobacteriaceae bacterium]|jgi:pyruvate dehydrogenase E2 component (dihydrolipoamide acetyltransferase)|nr:2-oxo acid dehydrogenase subunit E2 [Bifidobacteriaceae bacterium]